MKTQLEWIYFFSLSHAQKTVPENQHQAGALRGGDSARDPECPGGTNAGGMIFMTNWVILILIQDSETTTINCSAWVCFTSVLF